MSNSPIDADIVGSLGTLPTPPFVAMEIIRLTRDPESSANDLADVLSNDPVLATRILQVANSPAYGLAREVTTVDRATALLGLKAVKMMALSFSLAADVGDDAGALSLKTYWYHSLLNAVTARRWAELSHPGLSEEAFLSWGWRVPFLLGIAPILVGGWILDRNRKSGGKLPGAAWARWAVLAGGLLTTVTILIPLTAAVSRITGGIAGG